MKIEKIMKTYIGTDTELVFYFSSRSFYVEEHQEVMIEKIKEVVGKWVRILHDAIEHDEISYSWINLDNVDYFQENNGD